MLRPNLSPILLTVASAAILALSAACGPGVDNPSGGNSQGGNGAGHSTGGAGPSSGGGFATGGGFAAGGGSGCAQHCTADLKTVLDCNNEVVTQCDPNQGCAGGMCIDDPCEAARQSKSSYGCDYWALKTDIISDGSGACFAAFIANTWDTPVHITADRGGQPISPSSIAIPNGQGMGLTYTPYDPNAGLAPGEVAILFLSREDGFLPACPVAPALSGNSGIVGTGLGTAFHITTDRPIVAYQILPYGGGSSAATSATLLLPTSVWDTNYVAVNAYRKSDVVGTAQPSMNVVATEDNTQVTILPKTPIIGGPGVSPAAAGQSAVYTLNRGQFLQLSQDQELTGSPIQSDKPIGLWGAASCLNVPTTAYACDTAQQQIPPVKALGNEYVGVRYRGRGGGVDEAPPWRVVGMVNGTTLTWTPSLPPGAPTTVNLGDVYEFNATGPFNVTSQDVDHPFYLASYMTGGDSFNGEGDPEWVNVVPTAQYLNDYVFFTDPTYSETNLVVTRRPDKNGTYAEVNLDCAGNLTGWQSVGNYQYTRVDLVTGNFQNVGNCSNGRHRMTSDLPFGLTVWGWGSANSSFFTQYVSYAYPAGASVQPINEVVIVPVPQ
ncbi:MAG: IgGFc-binding protein [Polyangiaceae bacterium]